MVNFKNRSDKNTSTSETAPTSEEAHTRRIQDSITSRDPTRKLNLDRRTINSERRVNNDPNYCGQTRRYTIDRRLHTKDRRKSD